jgi:hypothetical protein
MVDSRANARIATDTEMSKLLAGQAYMTIFGIVAYRDQVRRSLDKVLLLGFASDWEFHFLRQCLCIVECRRGRNRKRQLTTDGFLSPAPSTTVVMIVNNPGRHTNSASLSRHHRAYRRSRGMSSILLP